MKVCIKCNQPLSDDFSPETPGKNPEEHTVKQLQVRIAELEQELRNLKTAAEKGDKLLKTMWGDNFNNDSLH